MAAGRNANLQPSYDFLTGSPTPPPLQQSFRQSRVVKPGELSSTLCANGPF